MWNFPIFFLYPQARGRSQGGRYRRKDSNGEVDDFLPEFFFHDVWFIMFDVFVIQSEAKNLGCIAQHSPVDVSEILRRYAPLDDKRMDVM